MNPNQPAFAPYERARRSLPAAAPLAEAALRFGYALI